MQPGATEEEKNAPRLVCRRAQGGGREGALKVKCAPALGYTAKIFCLTAGGPVGKALRPAFVCVHGTGSSTAEVLDLFRSPTAGHAGAVRGRGHGHNTVLDETVCPLARPEQGCSA